MDTSRPHHKVACHSFLCCVAVPMTTNTLCLSLHPFPVTHVCLHPVGSISPCEVLPSNELLLVRASFQSSMFVVLPVIDSQFHRFCFTDCSMLGTHACFLTFATDYVSLICHNKSTTEFTHLCPAALFTSPRH